MCVCGVNDMYGCMYALPFLSVDHEFLFSMAVDYCQHKTFLVCVCVFTIHFHFDEAHTPETETWQADGGKTMATEPYTRTMCTNHECKK